MSECPTCGAPVRISGLRFEYQPAKLDEEQRTRAELVYIAREARARYMRNQMLIERFLAVERGPKTSAKDWIKWIELMRKEMYELTLDRYLFEAHD